jgi:hypothetical protein
MFIITGSSAHLPNETRLQTRDQCVGLPTTHVKTHKLQQICSRLVAMLFQQLVNRMCSHCLFPAYKVVDLNRLVTSCSNNLLSSCNSTICQQVVSDNLVATWWNNVIVTTCWQACYKPVANTSCWQVVRFLCVYSNTQFLQLQKYFWSCKYKLLELRVLIYIFASNAWFPYGRNGRKDWVTIFLISRNTTL